MSLDLHALIREALAASHDPDPRLVAADVLGRIPAREVRGALALTLPRFVADVARTSPRVGPESSHPTSDPQPRLAASGPSRWDAVRLLLPHRVSVADGKWKFLADCTRDDILHAANVRRNHANAELVVADRLDALASRMFAEGATTVADLCDAEMVA
ncbi:MAG: hypothetical protein M3522_09355 [Actinomycetota bacterium]|nr:hypothetical protein [Actinomycetota bacterium]